MRILGEIPVRKFDKDGKQPLDPDGNPDTSFLAKIPADVAWTFQTLDKHGMVLNMAQTWHQLRPGEIRNDCGGCHAHSQKPTRFEQTAAAKPDYAVFDLTAADAAADDARSTISRARSGTSKDETGLRFETGVKNVEYLPRHQADLRAQLRRLPHAEVGQAGRQPGPRRRRRMVKTQNPAGPRLRHHRARHLRPPGRRRARASGATSRCIGTAGRDLAASRYVRLMQSRRSLLIWKVYGQRLDGWKNDDLPYETIPGDPTSLRHKGKPVADTPQEPRDGAHRLHRQHHAAAGGGEERQGEAAHRRGPADAGPLDRPRLPDRSDARTRRPAPAGRSTINGRR